MLEEGEENTSSSTAADHRNILLDYLFYQIGANVVGLVHTEDGEPRFWGTWAWKYQRAMTDQEFENEKTAGAYNNGVAMVMGKLWRGPNEGKYINGFDFDNQLAVKEFLKRTNTTIDKLSEKTLLEHHEDATKNGHLIPSKMHMYVISERLFENIDTYKNYPWFDNEKMPAIEVRCKGRLLYCAPGIYKNRVNKYQFFKVVMPSLWNDAEKIVKDMLWDFGITQHLARPRNGNGGNNLVGGEEGGTNGRQNNNNNDDLFKIHEGGRHNDLRRQMNAWTHEFYKTKLKEEVRAMCVEYNNVNCIPPLPQAEFDRLFEDCWEYALKQERQKRDAAEQKNCHKEEARERYGENIISPKANDQFLQGLYEYVTQRCVYKTMRDSLEVLYYDDTDKGGLYRFSGETKIKEELEKLASEIRQTTGIPFALTENQRNEVVKMVVYNTLIDREKFDCNKEIINVKNGLLNIHTRKLVRHTAHYLSLVQLPVSFDPKATCPNILKFFLEIQDTKGVSKLVRIFGYVLSKDLINIEKAIMFVGSGANGKSVMIKLIVALVGQENCSHVGLHELSDNRFLAAELFGKMVNAYADLPSEGIENTSMFKALVSGDYIKAEKKHQNPFSFRNYSKLIFSANRIPQTNDPTFAYLRRWVVLTFERYFADDARDENLIYKLTTEEELSGLLNIALVGLAKLIDEKGFGDTCIEAVREEYEYEEKIVSEFLDEKCVKDLRKNLAKYYVPKDELWNEFLAFCKDDKNIESKFESELLKHGIIVGRGMEYGRKISCYKGIITNKAFDKKNRQKLESTKQTQLGVGGEGG
jgi:P4 family phage/plasmid primase-like protien